MFLRSLSKRLLLVPLVAVLGFVGCRGDSGDDTYRDEQIAKLLNDGKTLLGKNQWGLAKETFQQVLNVYDGASSEARFGIVLADLLSFTDTIRLVSSLTDSLSSSANDEENQFVNQLITDLVHDLRAKFVSIDRNLLLVVADPGFIFNIRELPIYLSDSAQPSVEMHGEWDRADAFVLTALVKAVIGALNVVDSIDLRLDVLRVYDYFSQSAIDTGRLDHIVSIVTYVLNDPQYPHFLSVKADGGNETMDAARQNFADAIYNFQAALYMASLETDPQSNDILQYIDANGNHEYDPAIDPDSDKCAHLADVMADPSQEDRFKGSGPAAPENFSIFGNTLGSSKEQPFLAEQTACLLQKMRYNLSWPDVKDEEQTQRFGYTQAPRVSVLNDLLPLIAPIASSIIQDIELPDEIQGIVGLATPSVILSLVSDILGDSIEIDPVAYFTVDDGTSRAGNIRDMLPAWRNDATLTGGLLLDSFIIELECGVDKNLLPIDLMALYVTLPTTPEKPNPEIVDALICSNAWATAGKVSDTTHFDADAARLADFDLEPIPADGIESRLPYIAFGDASMHGSLYLNLSGMENIFGGTGDDDKQIREALSALDGNPSDFRQATLTDLNAFIATLSRNGTIAIALDAAE